MERRSWSVGHDEGIEPVTTRCWPPPRTTTRMGVRALGLVALLLSSADGLLPPSAAAAPRKIESVHSQLDAVYPSSEFSLRVEGSRSSMVGQPDAIYGEFTEFESGLLFFAETIELCLEVLITRHRRRRHHHHRRRSRHHHHHRRRRRRRRRRCRHLHLHHNHNHNQHSTTSGT